MPVKQPKKVAKQETEVAGPPAQSPRTLWYVLLIIVAVLVLAASTFLAWQRPVMGWEQRIFSYINNLPESLKMTAVILTHIGSTWMAVGVVAIAFIAKMYWLTWRLAFSILAGYSVVLVLKTGLERPRPEFLYPNSDVHLRVSETLAGFPSGHSMVITVVALTLLPFLPKVWRWIIAGLFIGLIGLSRIYLGVHAPLDIAGGIAIGAIVVCVIRLMPQKIRRFFRLG